MGQQKRTTADILADLQSIRTGTMPDGSTVAARATKKKKPVTLGDLADAPPRMTRTRKADINLPDEKKGKVVGDIDIYDAKGPDRKPFRVSRQILGGDADDPRWDEHRARVAAATRKKPSRLGDADGRD